jgi:DNA repair exonuclease SbcCD ATPase subunit
VLIWSVVIITIFIGCICIKLQTLITELGSVKEQLAVNRELQSEKDELERRLRDAQNHAKESDASETQLDVYQELQSEKEVLEQRLRVAEDNCVTFEKELQETNMELGGLKQNLEEAEQIELQNEELVSRLRDMSEEMADTEKLEENLKAIQSAMTQKDEMVRFNVNFDRESAFHSVYFCSNTRMSYEYGSHLLVMFVHNKCPVTQRSVGT